MPAAELDLTIEQGATFDKTLTWQDADSTPIDITGYVARMQIREEKSADAVLLELTDVNGRIVLGDAAGTIQLLINAADTEAFAFTSGVYDLELESPGGVVTRLVEGKVKVSLEVTR